MVLNQAPWRAERLQTKQTFLQLNSLIRSSSLINLRITEIRIVLDSTENLTSMAYSLRPMLLVICTNHGQINAVSERKSSFVRTLSFLIENSVNCVIHRAQGGYRNL